jgi:hopanoid biosynthesis associated protein HpnK
MAVIVVTNAGLLDKARVEKLADAGIAEFIISVDAMDADAHEDNRGLPGVCRRIREANRSIADLGAGSTASVTMSRLVDYEAVPAFLGSLGFSAVTFSYPLMHLASSFLGYAAADMVRYRDDELIEAFEQVKRLKKRFAVVNPTPSLEETQRLLRKEPQQYACLGGYKYFYLDWEFRLWRCHYWEKPLCSVFDYDGSQNVRDGCTRCMIDCYRDASVMHHAGIAVHDAYQSLKAFRLREAMRVLASRSMLGSLMAPCLVVVADDFGRSSSVNRAVADAHDSGVVTAASIMTRGKGFEEAVLLARKRSALSVGLHVTLCDGRSVLPAAEIPDLVDEGGHFEKSPVKAWIRYFRPALLPQIEREVAAQFAHLLQTGLRPTHVDGHHHLHMHPAAFAVICREAARHQVRWIRLPREPFGMAVRSTGRGVMPLIEWLVFGMLGLFHRDRARTLGLLSADRVYGLSRTGRLDEGSLLNMLERSGRDSVVEIFTHPDSITGTGRRELKALKSLVVRERIRERGIVLAGYGELPGGLRRQDAIGEGP